MGKRKILSFKELEKKIMQAKKDPDFMRAIDNFILYHSGRLQVK